MRKLAVLAVTSLLATTPACTMSVGGKRTLTVAGAAVTVAGVAVNLTATRRDADGNGINDTSLDDDLPQMAAGSLLALAGIAMFVAGVTADTPHPDASTLAPLPTRSTPGPAWTPPVLVAPAPVDDTLPALPATDDELRLARQARNLVRAHHCPDAVALVERLAATNVAYASAMRAQLACDPRGASSP